MFCMKQDLTVLITPKIWCGINLLDQLALIENWLLQFRVCFGTWWEVEFSCLFDRSIVRWTHFKTMVLANCDGCNMIFSSRLTGYHEKNCYQLFSVYTINFSFGTRKLVSPKYPTDSSVNAYFFPFHFNTFPSTSTLQDQALMSFTWKTHFTLYLVM